MIQPKERESSVNVLQKFQIVTPEQIICTLRGICDQRFHAYAHAPAGAVADSKFKAIEMIQIGLDYASTKIHWREKLRYCLKLESHFRTIATRKNQKAYDNYISRLNSITNACREAILWRA